MLHAALPELELGMGRRFSPGSIQKIIFKYEFMSLYLGSRLSGLSHLAGSAWSRQGALSKGPGRAQPCMLWIIWLICTASVLGQSQTGGWRRATREDAGLVVRVGGQRCIGFRFDRNHVVSTATCLGSPLPDPRSSVYVHRNWSAASPRDFNLAIAKLRPRRRSRPLVSLQRFRSNDRLATFRYTGGILQRRLFRVVRRRTCLDIYFARNPSASRTAENRATIVCALSGQTDTSDTMANAVGAPLVSPSRSSRVAAVYSFSARYRGKRYYFFSRIGAVAREF